MITFSENATTNRNAFDLIASEISYFIEFSNSRLYNMYYEYLDIARCFEICAFSNDEFLKT